MFVMLAHECSVSWTGVFEGIYDKPNACQESAECECMMLMLMYFMSFIISVTWSFLMSDGLHEAMSCMSCMR